MIYTGAVSIKFSKLTATETRSTLTLRLLVGAHLKRLHLPLALWLEKRHHRDREGAKTVLSCKNGQDIKNFISYTHTTIHVIMIQHALDKNIFTLEWPVAKSYC